jgi:hypothetical protein
MDVQDLIGEIARRHNVLVSADDPVFVGVTLNELLLAEYIRRVETSLDRARRDVAADTARTLEEISWAADQVIAKGARDASDQLRVAGAVIKHQFERSLLEALSALDARNRAVEQHRQVAFWSALMAVGCALFTLGVVLAHLLRGG